MLANSLSASNRRPPAQFKNPQDPSVTIIKTMGENSSPLQSPSKLTVHSPDPKDATSKLVLRDTPSLSYPAPLEKGGPGDDIPTFPQSAQQKVGRWTLWQVISGQRDTAEGSKGKGWKTAPFVFACEFGERAASFGFQVNIINYFIYKMNMSLVPASNLSTNFFGATALATFAGAFLADAYLGRYLTTALGGFLYTLGLGVFTISASVKGLRPTGCTDAQRFFYEELQLPPCQEANSLQMGVLYIAIVLQCLGSAFSKPCVAPFGADQFDRSDKTHEAQLRHYFNWFYMIVTVAMVISLSLFIYIQDSVSWGWGGGVPTIVMGVSTIIFLLGTHYYNFLPPYGSPLTRMVKVVVAAVKKRKYSLPKDSGDLYHVPKFLEKESVGIDHEVLIHTDQFRFLDKAAVLEEVDDVRTFHPWRLATINQVEELKQLLRMIPVWLSTIIVSLVIVQSGTLVVQQSLTMDRRLWTLKVPPASMLIFSLIGLLLLVPFYDMVLIRNLRKFTGNPRGLSYLQRIGVGVFINIFVMVSAAFVEQKRRKVAQSQPLIVQTTPGPSVLPISAFWLAIPLFLAGITECFSIIGQLEFFYEEAPESIRSMSVAFLWASLGLGGFLSAPLTSIVQDVTAKNGSKGWLQNDINQGRVDYYYWLLAVLSGINFLYYLVVSHWYVYKKTGVDDGSSYHTSMPISAEKE